ncbi:hypothetical protein M9H77_26412 [Catharanthus roseus]|uniref:Uncharacterized protein n=1 Tax=Catharanthus roseus TaxID=4058 RepID=A0ACC0AAG4_CATRO|nr:hypothetical protein M9H77_26412 [Catharanthus roseus]
MPCLKDNTITDNPSCDPSPSSILVEVEIIFEPTLEPPQEPETNSEFSAPSSSTLVPETSDPILDGSDEEEEHPETQTQALRDYQLARYRVCRIPAFFSFSFGSAAADLSLFLCFYAVNQSSSLSPLFVCCEVREIAVRKEKRERERDRGCLLPVISSRLRLFITPIITFLHHRCLDAAALLLGVRF